MLISSSGKSFHHSGAVFVDRDGVLNQSQKPDGSYLPVNTPEDLVVFSQAKEGAAELKHETPLPIIMVTNQGGIGAGYMTEDQLKKIDDKLLSELRSSGGDIDAIYFATSNDKSDPLRKPNPGMLLKAAEDLDIDLSKSYMIGDMTTDIACGHKAGAKTILVQTGAAGKDHKENVTPDVVVEDFKHAAEYIIAENNKK